MGEVHDAACRHREQLWVRLPCREQPAERSSAFSAQYRSVLRSDSARRAGWMHYISGMAITVGRVTQRADLSRRGASMPRPAMSSCGTAWSGETARTRTRPRQSLRDTVVKTAGCTAPQPGYVDVVGFVQEDVHRNTRSKASVGSEQVVAAVETAVLAGASPFVQMGATRVFQVLASARNVNDGDSHRPLLRYMPAGEGFT